MNTSARLAKARTEKGLSQEKLAEMLGLSQGAYSNYENGRELKSGMIVKICALLGCSPGWLLGVSESGERLPEDSDAMIRLREQFEKLNEEGQEKVIDYASDLKSSGRYLKSRANERVQDAGVSGVA